MKKKLFSILAFVAISLTASAQDLKTFDGKLFTCQYPANFEAQEQWMDEAFNAKIEDAVEFLSVSVNDQEMSDEWLKEWCEGMRGLTESSFGEPTGWKAGPVQVKGKMAFFRCEGEESVNGDPVPAVKFIGGLSTPDKKFFVVELRFGKNDEAKYKPLFDKIISTAKAR